MKEYSVILFDLDGTLTDPAAGLVEGFLYAFRKLGIDAGDRASLTRFIGPPLFEQWQRDFGFTYEETENAILLFREYYNIYGWWDNRVYEGIPEMLAALRARGKRLAVATSKPEDTAHKVLSLFGLKGYFDFIGGADGHKTRDKKHEVLEYTLRALGSPGREECILVGDRVFDAEGARRVGIDSLGVRWGHGTEEEINSSPFTYVARTPSEVLEIIK
ncbi:MAG: HAD-IA family hydrolase [Clostridia bacterium]|nr:HAD-IA family hydrolase [Clostridia bacterium]